MEGFTLKRLKKIADQIMEDRLLISGSVLAVRLWENSCMVEVDLHLPGANIEQWAAVPYIKFRVGSFTYRDYTPFGWDAETATCSLLIDTAHLGAGSSWAKQLAAGDIVYYLPAASTRQAPHASDLVVALGDGSSLAHLFALKQLTQPNTRFAGAVVLNNETQQQNLTVYFESVVKPFTSLTELNNWIEKQAFGVSHTWFYLTGNNKLVGDLRRQLKALGYRNFETKGFWG